MELPRKVTARMIPFRRFRQILDRARRGATASGLSLLVASLLLAAATLACGKKGPPQPPPRSTPQAANDLTGAQRGSDWLFEFAYPKTTVSGTPLPGLEAVELWRLRRPMPAIAPRPAAAPPDTSAPAPAAEPAPAAAPAAAATTATGTAEPASGPRLPAVDRREFAPAAELALRISGSELTSAIEGDRIRLRLPVGVQAEASVSPDAEATPPMADAFAVRSVGQERDASEFSNIVVLLGGTPPRAPGRLAAKSEEAGVALEWDLVEGSMGTRVYRRDATVRAAGRPLATVEGGVSTYLDRTVEVGRRYVYSVSALGAGAPLIESAAPVEQEIDYQDRFPPAPPRRPAALPDRARIRLVWESSPAPDVAGYVVFRAGPKAEFRRLAAEPISSLEYLDTDVVAGVRMRYRVAAIDRAGNLGDPSEVVETAAIEP